jgi:hypothetical protein
MAEDVAEKTIAKCKLMASKDEKIRLIKEVLGNLRSRGVVDSLVQRQVRTLEVALVATEGDLG